MIIGKGALAGLGLADGDAGCFDEAAERLRGLGVDDPPAGDDQRPVASANPCGRLAESTVLRYRPRDGPDAPLEELRRTLERFRLDVLRKGQRDGAGLSLVGKHAHRLHRGVDDLLRTGDAVEVARDRPEAVVHGDVALPGHLELLKHWVRPARRENVAGQEQHREPVDSCERRARDHVGGSGPDRGRASERAQAVVHARVARSRMHHRLLVASLVVGEQIRPLEERLADPAHVAMAEDPEAAADEAVLNAVALDVLVGQELDQGLRSRQP